MPSLFLTHSETWKNYRQEDKPERKLEFIFYARKLLR